MADPFNKSRKQHTADTDAASYWDCSSSLAMAS